MSFDPRWLGIARDWLRDSGVPDRLVTKYTDRLAQQLQDVAADAPFDIADCEREADAAARDAHVNRLIDEARGK